MDRHGNRQKHLNANPIQRTLLDKFHHKVADLIQRTGAVCMLDAGCGEGFVLKHLQETHQAPAVMFGGDFSGDALLWGRSHVEHKVPRTQFDLHHLPFPANSFPLVMCLEVLEHLPDSRVGLRELARVSSEYILVSVPHEPFFRGANFLRGKHIRAFGNDPEHFHNYSGRSFRQMAEGVVDIVWHGYAFPWQIALCRKRK